MIRAAAAERDAARLKALQELAASVPYAEAIAAIQADPLKATAASEASRFQEDCAPVGESHYGFSDEKLFKDTRFKLGLALRDAGVAHSAHAAKVVAQIIGPRDRNPLC